MILVLNFSGLKDTTSGVNYVADMACWLIPVHVLPLTVGEPILIEAGVMLITFKRRNRVE